MSPNCHDMQGPSEILLVEDYEPDTRLIALAFTRNGVANKLHIVHDAGEALDLLLDRNGSRNTVADLSAIGLVMVDIHLPKFDGWEVLHRLKENAATRHLDVIMLSGCVFPEDTEKARELGALGCLAKPVELDELRKILAGSRFPLAIAAPAIPRER